MRTERIRGLNRFVGIPGNTSCVCGKEQSGMVYLHFRLVIWLKCGLVASRLTTATLSRFTGDESLVAVFYFSCVKPGGMERILETFSLPTAHPRPCRQLQEATKWEWNCWTFTPPTGERCISRWRLAAQYRGETTRRLRYLGIASRISLARRCGKMIESLPLNSRVRVIALLYFYVRAIV